MSANHVDQRQKGQPAPVSNGGNKDVMKVDDSYLQQPQQHPVRPWSDQSSDGAYGAPPMSNAGVSDSFFQSYFTPNMSYPFMNQSLGTSEGPWSNGAGDMFGMGYDYNAMYSGFGFPYSNWESAGDYWSYSQPMRKDQRGYPSEDPYYPSPEMIPSEPYGMMNGAAAAAQDAQEPIGSVEQGLRNMTLQQNVSSDGRKKMDLSQPPVMADGYGSSEASLMMPQSSPSQSVPTSSVIGGGNSGAPSQGASSGQPKKTSWAAIASKPAAPQQQMRPRTIPRAPVNPNKAHNMDIGTWDMSRNQAKPPMPLTQQSAAQPPAPRQGFAPSAVARRQNQMQQQVAPASSATTSMNNNNSSSNSSSGGQSYSSYQGNGQNWGGANSGASNGDDLSSRAPPAPAPSNPVLDKLKTSNDYNPKEFNLNPKSARFFIIKSYSEDDIHRSIKYSIWCSTDHGNKRLDQAFREREGKGPVYLIYSVNGSGHFCGIAQMMTPVDYNRSAGVWAQDKWKGQFTVKWVYVKDVPNSCLRHIRLENNENKPVTNSRDTQEVPQEKGKQVLRIMHSYKHMTSIFDDFHHYEKLQKEVQQQESSGRSGGGYRGGERGDRGDRDNHRGNDRGERDHRGDRGDSHHHDRRERGDRGDHRGGDRDGGRGRDNRRSQN